MNLAPAEYPASGSEPTRFGVQERSTHEPTPMPGRIVTATTPRPEDDFGRLIRIVESNERLFDGLRALTRRLEDARAYLAEPGCHRHLGQANLAYLKVKYSGVLALLRANRLEAQALLGQRDSTRDRGLGALAPSTMLLDDLQFMP